jgi:hypothetical protein
MKSKKTEGLYSVILSHYGSTYTRPAAVQAMAEIEVAISIVDMIETESAKEIVESLQRAHDIIYDKYYNS